MWYILSAILGAMIGIFLFAIVAANRAEEDYWRGFRDGRMYENRLEGKK